MKFGKLFIIVLFVLAALAATKVSAESFVITGNGSGSSSTVLFDAGNSTVIQQTNTGSVNNHVNNNANTGGNSANGGSINTGNATTNVNITNNLNSNNATVTCCATGTPIPTPRPTNPPVVNPTATPTPGSNNGDGDGCKENCGSSNSGAGGSGGGQVLGLAGTSGEPWTEYLFYATGSLCLVAAKKLLSGAR